MISQFMSSGPASGSVLTSQSLEPALGSMSLSLSPFSAHALSLSVCLSKINIKKEKFKTELNEMENRKTIEKKTNNRKKKN